MLTVQRLVDEFAFDVVAGFKGLGKEITDPTLKRPSAELAGFLTYLTPSRLQVYGRTEMGLIEQLGPTVRMNHLEKVLVPEVPGLIVTRGLPVIEELRVLADEREIPLMTTNKSTTRLFYVLIRYLTNHLAPCTIVHGGLVDVFGVGVMITGESGIGKSEVALELLKNGHLMIADDAVEVRRVDEESLRGRAPERIKNLLEIRGLGIMDVTKLFGAAVVRDEKDIHLVVHLEEWEEGKAYDRLGAEMKTREILGIPLEEIIIPVRPGRNLASIIEVAVMQKRLKKFQR
ncbi:HPr kinase/phosphorylase [hprK] [Acididesulfobacillus acetoxydans]|uniref:HPr kinase/phosphorylase n=1 Tax=Acididesulfobacillus acetoxydans TaxID=1561005 RepID=A0A8S0Y2Z1_9FIRM|nr:HPr(Ser) kinase/phosphatase [Acididesulfobacillus acetoxydans]CAA7601385.1 HPr kinase/phosphorylase [hprK] [Acididesulfobacillus acetoxydans]CEJ07454.1 HPr kinase/phosphorylase [Acididesulfobacillus acetoxydans]